MDREIVNGAGDKEEDPINPFDLPEIDISDIEADAAEMRYEEMMKERK